MIQTNTQAPRGRGVTVIFKGSDRCNAGCHFCAVGDPAGKIISDENLEILLAEIERFVAAENIGRLTFTFHGGEPTLLGAPMMEHICHRISKQPIQVDFKMQSNLIRMPDDVLAVIDCYDIDVGTSFDPLGGERVDDCGNDAFPGWAKGYYQIAMRGKAPGAIYVATRAALGNATKLYRIAQALGALTGQRFGMQVNPVYAQGRAADGSRTMLISPEEFGQFLIDIWREWEANDRDVSLTPLSFFANAFPRPVAHTRHLPCIFNGICSHSHIGINYDLQVAGCGRRLDSGKYFGSLHQNSLASIVRNSPEPAAVAERGGELSESGGKCRNCDFWNLCHGGCPDDAELHTGDLKNKFPWCKSYSMLFEAMAQSYESGEYSHRSPANMRFSPREERPVPLSIITNLNDAPLPSPNALPPMTWIAPKEKANVLTFGSGLDQLLQTTKGPIRIWLKNSQVRSLVIWERFLMNRAVSIGLYEAEGLWNATNLLNTLKARIFLDVPSILLESTGEEELTRVVDRFLFDTTWKSALYPFSEIVTNISNRSPHMYRSIFGFSPGRVQLNPDTQDLGIFPASMAERIRTEAAHSAPEWLFCRQSCMECAHLKYCSSALHSGTTARCPDAAMRLVKKVHATTTAMIDDVIAFDKAGA